MPSERVQGRRRRPPGAIIEHPDVRRMLLTMRSQIAAMRALSYVAAAAVDRSLRHPDPSERGRAPAASPC